MRKDKALNILKSLRPMLTKEFDVDSIALFGSTARDQANQDSDIDIVVSFKGPATSKRYFDLQFLLEDELGVPIDLVTQKALRKEIRPFIEREAINI